MAFSRTGKCPHFESDCSVIYGARHVFERYRLQFKLADIGRMGQSFIKQYRHLHFSPIEMQLKSSN